MAVIEQAGALPVSRRGAAWRSAADVGVGRWAEVALALLLLLAALPLFLLIALLVRVSGGGPAIFAQRRLGRGGRAFSCLKFRTMHADAEQRLHALLTSDPRARVQWAAQRKLRHDPRVTRLGVFLRKSSLDELPQLLNVLRGDMSLVGPRPIVEAERGRYGRRFRHYASVRPGITGLWQVSGRNDVSYRRRIAFDVVYSRRKCVALDCRILLATAPAVLLSRGTY